MNKKKQKTPEIDNKKKLAVLKEVTKMLEDRYIYLEVAERIKEKLFEKFNDGFFNDFNQLPIFALKVDEVLKEISKDKHLYLLYNNEMLEDVKIELGEDLDKKNKLEKQIIEKEKQANFGFQKLEILEGNIGYLDLRSFCNSNEAFETAVTAMNFLGNTNAVIIDLCNNGGGESEMVHLLASYFLKMNSQLNYIIRRFEGITEQNRTLPYVPGKRMLDKKLYLLTSSSTFSAAEDFIYALKCQKRVTIVGEQTKGGGHPVDFYPILDTYVLMLPNARSYNPISKDNWEGKGIAPDVSVSANVACFTAYQLALDYLISKESDSVKKLFLQLAREKNSAKETPIKVKSSTLQKLAGQYESSKLIFKNNKLIWFTSTAGDVELTAITNTVFFVDKPGFAGISLMFENINETNEMLLHFFYERDYEIITRKRIE